MNKVAIVYWSGTGNTKAMANLVAEGVVSAGAQADVFTAADFSPEKANEYERIAFGCPSMGAEQLEESEFEPMFSEVKPLLKGKSVGLFGSYGWGDGEWMRNWEEDCRAIGCKMPSDFVIVNGAPEGNDAESCKNLGQALAK